MLQQPQNPNTVDSQGRSALMAASEAGHLEVLRLLLEAGAHVNYHDNEGETAMALASLMGPRGSCAGADGGWCRHQLTQP